jgi:RNA polymerase sigma-70 factor (ECF subfamily)
VSAFPATRHSAVREAASPDPETRRRGFEALATAYWKAVYKHLRFTGASREDAEDLTQGFFARAYEKGFFDGYDPERSRFRTFLRVCLDGFVSNERAAARTLKRGSGQAPLSLDFEGAEGELLRVVRAPNADPDEAFRQEWVRAVFAQAVDSLRRRAAELGKGAAFAVFERYDLEGPDAVQKPTYADLGRELGLPVTQVTNHLSWARREFRRLAVDALASQCGSDEEFQAEARELFGPDALR